MPRMSAHQLLLEISRLETAIAERTAVAKALQVPVEGAEQLVALGELHQHGDR